MTRWLDVNQLKGKIRVKWMDKWCCCRPLMLVLISKNWFTHRVSWMSNVIRITRPLSLYRYLLRQCNRLPPDVRDYYKYYWRQQMNQHLDETDVKRAQEIMDQAVRDMDWIINKYQKQNPDTKPPARCWCCTLDILCNQKVIWCPSETSPDRSMFLVSSLFELVLVCGILTIQFSDFIGDESAV